MLIYYGCTYRFIKLAKLKEKFRDFKTDENEVNISQLLPFSFVFFFQCSALEISIRVEKPLFVQSGTGSLSPGWYLGILLTRVANALLV